MMGYISQEKVTSNHSEHNGFESLWHLECVLLWLIFFYPELRPLLLTTLDEGDKPIGSKYDAISFWGAS